jgi:hypothetical protein
MTIRKKSSSRWPASPLFVPRLEKLEARETPAVNVTINYLAGLRLFITGDAGNDEILINSTVNPGGGVYDITGLNGTTVTSTHPDAESIAGGVRFYYVQSMTLNMGDGNDIVNINRANLVDLYFNGGNGNDTLNIGSAPSDHAFMTVTFNGGAGNDIFNLHNGFNRVVSKLKIDGGDGINTIKIGEQATDQTTLGSLEIYNGHGNDSITVAGKSLTVEKHVYINNGLNDPLKDPTNGSTIQFLTTENLTVGGATTIINGFGDNTVQFGTGGVGAVNLHALTVKRTAPIMTTTNNIVTIAAGHNSFAGTVRIEGASNLTAQGATFQVFGNLQFVSPNSSAIVNLASTLSTAINLQLLVDSKFAGADVITIGAGNTTAVNIGSVDVQASASGAVNFNGRIHTINGSLKSNNASVTAGGESFTVGGAMTVSGALTLTSSRETVLRGTLIAGNGNVTFGGGRVNTRTVVISNAASVTLNSATTIQGALNIKGVAAGSTIIDSNSTLDVIGNVAITTFGGADTIRLDGTSTGISGSLYINSGLGSDLLVGRNLYVFGATTCITGPDSVPNNPPGTDDDTVQLDDSSFYNSVNVRTGYGNDTVLVETLNTGIQTHFFGSFFGGSINLNTGFGSDTITLGRPADTDDFVDVYFTATIVMGEDAGGGDFDVLNYLTASNVFYWDFFRNEGQIEDIN